jgi:diguanylate cyclase (GGDEF)-like protein
MCGVAQYLQVNAFRIRSSASIAHRQSGPRVSSGTLEVSPRFEIGATAKPVHPTPETSKNTRMYERVYWWFSVLCALTGFLADKVNGVHFGYSLAYAAGGVVAFSLHRARKLAPVTAILLHLTWAQVVLIFASHMRFGGFGGVDNATALDHQAVLGFIVIATVGLAIYGGKRWAVLGFTMALLAKYRVPSLAFQTGLLALFTWFGAMLHDALEQAEVTRKQLEDLAFLDPLTGLLNRRAANVQYTSYKAIAQRNATTLMLMVWDLDGLKSVNDKQGHAAGDAYLQEFAAALKSSLRSGDVAFRTGGDEFVTFHLGLAEGAIVAERVRTQFANVSVGCSVDAQATFDTLVRRADERMYTDKAARRAARPSAA